MGGVLWLMRVLWIDSDGGSGALDILMRMQADGHAVRWFMRKPFDWKVQSIGKGLVEVVQDWHEHVRWADLIIQGDNTWYTHEMDQWRARGYPIVGASKAAAEWELDRTLGQQVFKKAGVKVSAYREFMRYDDAIAYVKKEMRRFVSKPLGDEEDKSLSYCASDAADMVYMLERWKRNKRHKAGFILQDFVSGCEMAVGGFFGPHGFNEGWCENWETKKLFNGDKGPATGEMGTTLRFVKSSKLADKVLKPLEEALHGLGYVGYVDVNCILDENGDPWPLEFTMRFGWPTAPIQQALIDGDHAEWLADLAHGRDAKPFLLNKVAVGVVMALPDFPYSHVTRKDVTGIPVHGLTPSVLRHVHPAEMMLGEAPVEVEGKIVTRPIMVSAGDYLLTATGVGESVRQARAGAYRVLDRLSAPASPFYRTDIGTRLGKQLPDIQSLGYATGLTF
jgi:phosphoribosylamine--glycine ligase